MCPGEGWDFSSTLLPPHIWMLEGYFRIIGSFLNWGWYLDKWVMRPAENLWGEGRELWQEQLFKISSFFLAVFSGPATLSFELKSDYLRVNWRQLLPLWEAGRNYLQHSGPFIGVCSFPGLGVNLLPVAVRSLVIAWHRNSVNPVQVCMELSKIWLKIQIIPLLFFNV